MSKIERGLYINLVPAVGVAINSREDPSQVDFGPVFIAGTKPTLVAYLGYVIAQAFEPLTLPATYTVKLSARRADNESAPLLLDEVALNRGSGDDGLQSYEITLNLTPQAFADLHIVPDEGVADGVRLRCELTVAAPDQTEVYKAQWLSIFHPAVK